MSSSGGAPRDEERREKVRLALERNGWDALVCTFRSNVLLLSGYWPVIGTAIAVATRDGAVSVLAPEDEEGLAARGWADVVHTFQPGSLDAVTSVLESVTPPLAALLESQPLAHATVAFEKGGGFDPAGYASGFAYGACLPHLLRSVLPAASLVDGTSCLCSPARSSHRARTNVRAQGVRDRAFGVRAHSGAATRGNA